MKIEEIKIKSIPDDETIELEGRLTVKQGFGFNLWHDFKFVMTNKALWIREQKTDLIQIGIKDMHIDYSDIESYSDTKFMLRKGLIFNYTNSGKSTKIYFDKQTESVKQILDKYIKKQGT